MRTFQDFPLPVLDEFFKLRRQYYRMRKERYLEIYKEVLLKLKNQERFILRYLNAEILVAQKKADLVSELREKGFMPIPKNTKGSNNEDSDGSKEGEEQQGEDSEGSCSNSGGAGSPQLSDFDYLLEMMGSCIIEKLVEKLEELRNSRVNVEGQIMELMKQTEETLWEKDLDALGKALKETKEEEARKAKSEDKAGAGPSGTNENPPQPVKPKGKPGPEKGAAKKLGKSSVVHIEDEEDLRKGLPPDKSAVDRDGN